VQGRLRRRRRDPDDPLEGKIEDRFVAYVHGAGGLTRKVNGMGFADWPDRVCLKPGVAAPLWCELKRIGRRPTTSQRILHKRLRALGQKVVVCDTLEKAKAAYDAHSDVRRFKDVAEQVRAFGTDSLMPPERKRRRN